MSVIRIGKAIALLGLVAASGFATANDIRINGFASIVAGATINESQQGDEHATYIADQPSGAIYDNNFSFKPDTLYGLQITSDLSDGLSVVGQIIGTGGQNFDAKMSWGYIKYEFDDQLSVLGGRQRLPLYFYSDVLDVGYSYHWMRPPTDGALPTDTLDGLQVRYDSSLGNWDTRLQLFTGSSDAESIAAGIVGFDNIYGAVAFASNDWLQLRTSYMSADLYAENNPLQNRDNPIGTTYWSGAAHMTVGDLFIIGEYTINSTDEPFLGLNIDEIKAGFLSIGYGVGDVTPHLTYSFQSLQFNNVFGLPGLVDQHFDDQTLTIGTRWDFHPKAALKVEYLSRSDDDAAARYAAYSSAGLDASTSIRETDLFSIGVDVIF